jgi:hypothetical protein
LPPSRREELVAGSNNVSDAPSIDKAVTHVNTAGSVPMASFAAGVVEENQ